MKRTPLKRVTPMPRQAKPLRFRSAKAAKVYRDGRNALNRELIDEPRFCQFPGGCMRRAVCWHEYVTRGQGGSIIDRSNLRASCLHCNGWAEDHIAEAHDIGWRFCAKRAAQLAIEGTAA